MSAVAIFRSVAPRLLPLSGPLDVERWWKRALFGLIALAIMAGYFVFLMAYWAPADPGLNQNGYLVGGKMLALHGTMGVKSADPFQFVGWMWNLVEPKPGAADSTEHWFYPKYPIGVPAIYALLLKINWQQGKIWAFYVSPVTATLALGAMFMLIRLVAGSFMAVMGMLILGCSQVLLQFADAPLSHAPALCAVTWGVFLLLRWWQTASAWRGVLAGLFLGYAATTRYTEGLLVLPVALAILTMIRYDAPKVRWWTMSVLFIGAVAMLVLSLLHKFPVHQSVGDTFASKLSQNLYAIAAVFCLGIVCGIVPHFRRDLSTIHYPQKKSRIIAIVGHWSRIVIAAILVYAIAFVQRPAEPWNDRVAGIVGLTIFKVALAGALILLFAMPWTEPRRYRFAIWPVLAWFVPVCILLTFNKVGMHSWTGYDSTNESTAFTWKMFAQKWDETAQQMHDYSMFLIPGLAIVGLALMYRANWRVALTMTLWFVPGLLLYTSYYFGEERPGMWYLRFFLTIFPPMLVGAMWLMKSAIDGSLLYATPRALSYSSPGIPREAGRESSRDINDQVPAPNDDKTLSQPPPEYRERSRTGSIAGPIGVGILTFFSCAVGLRVAIPPMERELSGNLNLALTCREIAHAIPTVAHVKGEPSKDPLVFADTKSMGHVYPLDNMLSFAGDYDLYPADGFMSYGFGFPGKTDPNAPTPLQPARSKYLSEVFSGKSEAELIAVQNRIMREALTHDRRAYAVLMGSSGVTLFKKFITPDFSWQQVASWNDPLHVAMEKSVGPLDPISRGMPLYFPRAAQSWLIYEIKLRPNSVSTQPTTLAPTATKPASANEKVAAASPDGSTIVAQTPVNFPVPIKVTITTNQVTTSPSTLAPQSATAQTTPSVPKSGFTWSFQTSVSTPTTSATTAPTTLPATAPTTLPTK